MKSLVRALRHFLLALQFFTRIPVTGRLAAWVGFSPDMLRASAAHFPAVGLLVGACAALVYGVAMRLLPDSALAPLLAAALGTAATVLLTGAFHEDGLADVADGLGGSAERQRALAIMKDSRIGAFGAIALVLALLVKVALLGLLGSVDLALACCGLLAAHAASRALALSLIYLLPYVGDTPDPSPAGQDPAGPVAQSKAKPLADRITPASLLVALLWVLVAFAAALALGAALASAPTAPDVLDMTPPVPGTDSAGTALVQAWVFGLGNLASGLAFAVLAWLWMWRWFARRLQGFTGDCLGATQQVCELAFYFGLAVSV